MPPKSTLTKQQYLAEGNKNKDFRKLPKARQEQIVDQFLNLKFMDLRCDWAFKRVMSDPELLCLLLNDFLPEQVQEVTSVNTEPKRLNGSEKNVLMDIVARTVDGREIVIEMQRFDKTNFKARMFYYGSAMVRSQLPRGKNYAILKPVYVICFMDFILKHLTDQLVYRYQMMEQNSHEIYGNWLSIFLCELPRLQKSNMADMDHVESWLHIFRESANFAGRPEGMDKRFDGVVEAAKMQALPESEKMDYFKAMLSDKERLEYGEDRFAAGKEEGRAEGRAEGREEGLAEGMEKGMEKKAFEVAAKLSKMGLSLSDIAAATGLSEEEINREIDESRN